MICLCPSSEYALMRKLKLGEREWDELKLMNWVMLQVRV